MRHTLTLSFILTAAICFSGCAKNKMVKGDIPLTTIPAGTFIEPPAEFSAIFQPVLFDYDRSDVRKDMETQLISLSEWLSSHPAVLLRVEGHCDERGSNEYNLALGERRALSIRKFLSDQGVSAARISTISYGEERPANSTHDEFAWAQNRRGEFKVSQ